MDNFIKQQSGVFSVTFALVHGEGKYFIDGLRNILLSLCCFAFSQNPQNQIKETT